MSSLLIIESTDVAGFILICIDITVPRLIHHRKHDMINNSLGTVGNEYD